MQKSIMPLLVYEYAVYVEESTEVMVICYFCFFFQAEDGIRDKLVTGVQTCALPICRLFAPFATDRRGEVPPGERPYFTIPIFNWYAGEISAIYQRQYIDSAQRFADAPQIGRASCRERV